MMSNITGEVRLTADIRVAGGSSLSPPQRFQIGIQCLLRRAGIEIDRADRVHAATYSFDRGISQEIDLLVLVGPAVRLFMAKLTAADPAAWLQFGVASQVGWGEVAGIVRPGTATNHGGLAQTAPNHGGMPVTQDSRILRMTPSDHPMTLDLIIVGCSGVPEPDGG